MSHATPAHVVIDGDTCHLIEDVDTMDPFLLALTSASDVWAYLTSNGGISAGRRNADHALFPYVTEDVVRDSAETTGGVSVVTVLSGANHGAVWRPFAGFGSSRPEIRRSLLKTDLGDVIHFEETHATLGLTLRVTWRVSPRYGLVRSAVLVSSNSDALQLQIVDGVRNVLPPGVTARTQRELAPLLDAYKVTEIDAATGLAWVRLNARLTDRAEAAESLDVTTMWHHGLPKPEYALTPSAVTKWPEEPARQCRGERAAYLLRSRCELAPGEQLRWLTCLDVDRDTAHVIDLLAALARPGAVAEDVEGDIAGARARLRGLVAAADGWQCSGRPAADAHHASSTLFNIMRGGVPPAGYSVDSADVRWLLAIRNRPAAARCRAFFHGLPSTLSIQQLRARARAQGDLDLTRIAGEYLPLTFSRRHGDPSRPWNVFDIVLSDDHGAPRLAHQGNWRDIFQNWEALAWSFPGLTESMVRTFLNATTIDGYNPYRISREGVDWEVPEPENPWSNIGYWSDHQIIYLVRLVELLRAQDPEATARLVATERCVHVDIPYVLASYDALLLDAQNTVAFDHDRHAAIMERVARLGTDGRLLQVADGELRTCSVPEKLLILLTAKLVNFVPDGGIWMNTQRPEWNDANNALVGRGLSLVTVAHLHRYTLMLEELLAGVPSFDVASSLAAAVTAITSTLGDPPADAVDLSDETRRDLLDQLGEAGTAYRSTCRDDRATTTLTADEVLSHLRSARGWLARAVRRARRADGLYDAYNLLTLAPGRASVERMPQMLEGQVAVLNSAVLEHAAVAELLATLPTSSLYRPDAGSYQLYPEIATPTLLERNRIPTERAAQNPLLRALVESADRRVVVADVHGHVHFAGGIHNAVDITSALAELAQDEQLRPLIETSGDDVLAVFEEVFAHARYTGRSSSFFAYEGVGSIYWHMVSKLMLAVREELDRAIADETVDPRIRATLTDAYLQVRSGLGFSKSARAYGAFPHDPYSHTPAGRGARQPGMTGQVKEDMLARWAELGVFYRGGQLGVDLRRVEDQDWLASPTVFRGVDVAGVPFDIPLPAGAIGLTVAQVPIILHGTGDRQRPAIQALDQDGRVLESAAGALSVALSASVMSREGVVERILVGRHQSLDG